MATGTAIKYTPNSGIDYPTEAATDRDSIAEIDHWDGVTPVQMETFLEVHPMPYHLRGRIDCDGDCVWDVVASGQGNVVATCYSDAGAKFIMDALGQRVAQT